MEQGSEISIDEAGAVTILHIKGDVTASSESSFSEAYKNLNHQETAKIIFKFRENAYINSGGIAVLIQILAETKKNSQDVAIVGLSDHFEKIFNMVGITKFARIFKTVDEATENLV